MVTFEERDLLGGWSLAVQRSGVTLGHIRKHADNSGYAYFSGPDNRLSPTMEEGDLALLKKRVELSLR